ncbi:MAG: hypothetical protein GEV08_20825, partial [Acidimicrobiia bacterium]|nr:hypothetical protein [Acidimicrobiia bacterium]
RRVADAVPAEGRVLVVDTILDPEAPDLVQTRMDLLMRLLFASHERTLEEWRELGAAAGLQLVGTQDIDPFRSAIELRPHPGTA